MKTSFRRLIATRYLLSKRKEAFISIITIISVIGVAVGVIVINVAMAIMTGFEFELRKKIVASDSHITVRKLKGGIGNWESIGKEIRRVKGVSDVSPFTYHQALLKTKLGTVGVLIRGVKKDTSTARQLMKSISGDLKEGLFSYSLAKNEPKSTANLAGMVIGRELSRTLSLHVGDKVTVISPMAGSSPLGLIPRFRRFVISGIYSSGLSGYESTLVYIDLGTAQEFFRMRNSITGFQIRVDDIDRAPEVAARITKRLDPSYLWYVQDWTEANKPLWNAMQLEKNVYFIVLLLIIVMASFSIISTLVMLVLEKRGDIAILRTLGASASDIGKIFRLQGIIIGLAGTISGLVGGYIACLALDYYGFPLDERIFPISTVPVTISWSNFALVGACSFAICYLATIYPAWRASRLEPASVLRYE